MQLGLLRSERAIPKDATISGVIELEHLIQQDPKVDVSVNPCCGNRLADWSNGLDKRVTLCRIVRIYLMNSCPADSHSKVPIRPLPW